MNISGNTVWCLYIIQVFLSTHLTHLQQSVYPSLFYMTGATAYHSSLSQHCLTNNLSLTHFFWNIYQMKICLLWFITPINENKSKTVKLRNIGWVLWYFYREDVWLEWKFIFNNIETIKVSRKRINQRVDFNLLIALTHLKLFYFSGIRIVCEFYCILC